MHDYIEAYYALSKMLPLEAHKVHIHSVQLNDPSGSQGELSCFFFSFTHNALLSAVSMHAYVCVHAARSRGGGVGTISA